MSSLSFTLIWNNVFFFHFRLYIIRDKYLEKKEMVGKVELVPISDGNRITVKENEKVIVGRGSSLGVCISYQ